MMTIFNNTMWATTHNFLHVTSRRLLQKNQGLWLINIAMKVHGFIILLHGYKNDRLWQLFIKTKIWLLTCTWTSLIWLYQWYMMLHDYKIIMNSHTWLQNIAYTNWYKDEIDLMMLSLKIILTHDDTYNPFHGSLNQHNEDKQWKYKALIHDQSALYPPTEYQATTCI